MREPLIDTQNIFSLILVGIIPWIIYFVLRWYPYINKNPSRCTLELWTGLALCFLAYEDWTYILIYFTLSLCDIFMTQLTISTGVLFLYAHLTIFILNGPRPFFFVFALPLLVCRIIRCLQKPVISVKKQAAFYNNSGGNTKNEWINAIHC